MGKSRRNKNGAGPRRNPIAKPTKPPTDPELIALRETKVLPIIKQLQSAEPKSRSAAASAVSTIIHDPKCRKLLLREQIVHTVLNQTLTDTALESRAAGWGILQVLAQEEEADFCVHLYRLDIVTAIDHASQMILGKLLSPELPFYKLSPAEQKTVLRIASSVIALVTVLAEAQDEIFLSIVATSSVISLLFNVACFDYGDAAQATQLQIDGMAAIMVLCEDNKELAQICVVSEGKPCFETLLKRKDKAGASGVLACGVLHNIFTSLEEPSSTLASLSIPDDSILVSPLSRVIGEVGTDQPMSNGSGWSSPFEYQQLALEIVASIGTDLTSTAAEAAKEEENEEWGGIKDDEDMEEADGDDEHIMHDDPEADGDEMDQDEMEADMDMVTGNVDNDSFGHGIDDLPVLKALVELAVPELLRIARLEPTDETTARLQGLAMSALNNIAWSIAILDFSDRQNDGIRKVWEPVGSSIWKTVIVPILFSDTADIELATQVTSLAWALSRSLRHNTLLSADEHLRFISLYQATKGSAVAKADAPFEGLGVKCIGVLGQLALDPAPVNRNRDIGIFMMTVLAGLPETPPADAVEALNQVFDIYADEDFACDVEVFWKNNFIKHLEEAVPKVRGLVKSIDKNKRSELRSRAEEALMNLNRFLGYKRKHKPQDAA